MHHLAIRKNHQRLTQAQMDEEVFHSASKIRSSAAFGEIIILMVYIPHSYLGRSRGQDVPPYGTNRRLCYFGCPDPFPDLYPCHERFALPKQ